MSKEKKRLTNKIIEGFLYLYLNDWKSEKEIYKAFLERFGDKTCNPSDLNDSGIPVFQNKVKKVLELGIRNNMYEYNAKESNYKLRS